MKTKEHKTNDYGYTSLAVLPKTKDRYMIKNIEWNIKNPKLRKTKAEFLDLLLDKFEDNSK